MLNVIIRAVFWLLARICDIVLLPVTLLIKGFLPDISQWIYNIEYFLGNYVFNTLKFVKTAFMNITGFPQAIWEFIWLWIGATLIIHGSIPVYHAIINVLNKFKTD